MSRSTNRVRPRAVSGRPSAGQAGEDLVERHLATARAVLAVALTTVALYPLISVPPSWFATGTNSFPFLVAVLVGSVAATYLSRFRGNVEADLLVRLMRHVRVDAGLTGTLEALSGEVLRNLGAQHLLMAVSETATGRAFLWKGRASHDGETTLQRVELAPAERDLYFFPAPVGWRAWRRSSRDPNRLDLVAIDDVGRRVRHPSPAFIPDWFIEPDGCDSWLGIAFGSGGAWDCRVFVSGRARDRLHLGTLRLVQRLVAELSPAVYNIYLLHRLQERAAAIERAHLARCLHDGVTQSLIAAEMRVHATRRRIGKTFPAVDGELSNVQDILRQEVMSVRDLTQRIKPLHVAGHELIDCLAGLVAKFERETGVSGTLIAELEQVSLPPRTCAEIARIVQEALCNVRKHSAARKVDVHLIEGVDRWSLIIEDDGRGLGSTAAPQGITPSGSTQETLRRPSPAVIRECVQALGGTLALAPAVGGGLRLDISIPAFPSVPVGTGASSPVALTQPLRAAATASKAAFGMTRSRTRTSLQLGTHATDQH